MTHIIEDLWNGNIAPCDCCGVYDPEINELVILMERNKTRLYEELSLSQQALLEKYTDCQEEYALRMMEQAFCDGFSLASKMLTQALLRE